MDPVRLERIINSLKSKEGAPDWDDARWRGVVAGASLGGADDATIIDRVSSVFRSLDNTLSVSASARALPPSVCATTASGLSDSRNKRKYEESILPSRPVYGAFVLVPSYLAFVMGMIEFKQELHATTKSIIGETVEDWCPKKAKTTEKEKPRIVQLARLLAKELAAECVSVVHQVPILPSEKKADDQDVDVAIFVESMKNGDAAHVAVTVEYKPERNFESFEAQAAAYGTDYMGISQRSMVVVQVHGTNMSDLYIRAFGVIPYEKSSDMPHSARHRKTLLCDGNGIEGLTMLVAGLKGYVKSFRDEEQGKWTATRLSNVTALHNKDSANSFVIKAYDYRTRTAVVNPNDRRQPNFHLVQYFIDEKAELLEPEKDLCMVKTKFYFRDESVKEWFDYIPVSMLGELVENLKKLHDMGYVHGDVRLLNTIPHEGRLVDFDFTKKEDELYPSNLQALPWDGKRAKSVDEAILDGDIGKLAMKKEHDLEAMLNVMRLFEARGSLECTNWWKDKVLAKNSSDDLFDLIAPLKKGGFDVRPTKEQMSGEASKGTESPQK